MHPQLEILLQIQDLRTQRKLLREEEAGERSLQQQEFNVDVDRALEDLDAKIDEMEGELAADIRGRYDRISAGRGRVVAPVINGTCFACFVSVPTAHGSGAGLNASIRHCENCGRFIYVVP